MGMGRDKGEGDTRTFSMNPSCMVFIVAVESAGSVARYRSAKALKTMTEKSESGSLGNVSNGVGPMASPSAVSFCCGPTAFLLPFLGKTFLMHNLI